MTDLFDTGGNERSSRFVHYSAKPGTTPRRNVQGNGEVNADNNANNPAQNNANTENANNNNNNDNNAPVRQEDNGGGD